MSISEYEKLKESAWQAHERKADAARLQTAVLVAAVNASSNSGGSG